MSAVYLLLATSIVVELVPVVVALRRRGRLPRPLLLVAICFAVMFAQDVVMWWMAERRQNNLWLTYFGVVVRVSLLLPALAHWQVTETERRAVRLAAVAFLPVWLVLFLVAEDPRSFSRFIHPIEALLLVAVAAGTLVRRSTQTLESPTAEPWFWIGSGLLLYYGPGVVLSPASRLLLMSSPELMMMAYNTKIAISIVAYLLVARGMSCLQPSRSSGGSSSPPVSSASSSPAPSWPRS